MLRRPILVSATRPLVTTQVARPSFRPPSRAAAWLGVQGCAQGAAAGAERQQPSGIGWRAAASVLASATTWACTSRRFTCRTAVVKDAEEAAVELHVCDHHLGGDEDLPVVVLVHGLDSWTGTWQPTSRELERRGIGSVSLDLRGHGRSPLGSPADFSPRQLAADLHATLKARGILQRGIVLVGHSMGGKVALRYGADFPDGVKALVIEDMDCTSRAYPAEYLEPSPAELERRRSFDRAFKSWPECRDALVSFGYDASRVEGWRTERPARVFPHGEAGGVWSSINPYAQWLARRTVLSQPDAFEALHRIAATRASTHPSLAVHVFVGGDAGTVCSWDAVPGGIRDMEAACPGLIVTKFPAAGHSIHRDESSRFCDLVEGLARGAV